MLTTNKTAIATTATEQPYSKPTPVSNTVRSATDDDNTAPECYYTWEQIRNNRNNSNLIVINDQVYDVSSFMAHHPGGSQIIVPFLGRDATRVFKGESLVTVDKNNMSGYQQQQQVHVHSKAAYKMLQDYRVGSLLLETATVNTNDNAVIATSEASSGAEAPSCPQKTSTPRTNKEMTEQQVRSRAAKRHLSKYGVDIDKPLVTQVWNLAPETYQEWINDALPGTARLFGNDLLESTTRTKWQKIPLFWVPVILSLIYLAVTLSGHPRYGSLSVVSFIGLFLVGELFWAWFEYCLHRFVFHWKPRELFIPGTRIRIPVPIHVQQLVHFLLHGIHHILPMDGDRLVAPPALSVSVFVLFLLLPVILPVFTVLYSMDPEILYQIFPACMVLAAGMGTGYVGYDMIHYYLHHGKPSFSYLKYLKSAHMAHHYDEHERYFGVSNPMFDFVMGTG